MTQIYVPVRDTVNVCLPSPVGFVPYGLISPTPLQIDDRRGQVTLNYFQPDSVRWQRDTYVIPPRRWGFYTDAGLECSPVRRCPVDLLANVRHKSVTGHFGYQIGEFAHGWTGGVRVKLVGWRNATPTGPPHPGDGRSVEDRCYASVEMLLNQSPVVASQPLEVKTMKKDQVIQSDPDVLSGTPVFAGTRVPIQTLVDYLKAGESLEDFLDGFPSVSRAQAEALLQISLDSALAEKDAHSA